MISGYRVFFWSNEGDEPLHVHVCKGMPRPNATKPWITASGGCILASKGNEVSARDLNVLMDCILAQFVFIRDVWKEFFHVDVIKLYG